MANHFHQGLYVVKNPHKYLGDVTKVRYMSSWEYECHTYFDCNDQVIKWGSETIAIPYLKPTDGRIHKYFVDYFVQYINKDGEVCTELIEVKPLTQTKLSRSKNARTKLYENVVLSINRAKWAAATEYVNQKGWKFRIVTEKSIFK
jgi:hypothetical protein